MCTPVDCMVEEFLKSFFLQLLLHLFAEISALLPETDPGRGWYSKPSAWLTFVLHPTRVCCQEELLRYLTQRTFYLERKKDGVRPIRQGEGRDICYVKGLEKGKH